MDRDWASRALAEFVGTFTLVFLGAGSIIVGERTLGEIAFAHGLAIAVMVSAVGHISGAHFNPAVTLAVWLRGRSTAAEVPFYMASQVAGAVVAALVVLFLKGAPAPSAAGPDPLRALLAELLFTFALAYVVLNVATTRDTAGNSYFGLAIGFTVLAGAFAVGGISGGAFNPAVAVGI